MNWNDEPRAYFFYLLKIWYAGKANWEMALSFSWEIRKTRVIGKKRSRQELYFH